MAVADLDQIGTPEPRRVDKVPVGGGGTLHAAHPRTRRRL